MNRISRARRVAIGPLVALLVLSGLVTLGGCWSRKEMTDLAFVSAIGIDQGEQPATFRLTALVVNPKATATPTAMGAPGEPTTFTVSTEAATLLQASRELTARLGRRAFFVQIDLAIVSATVARQGLTPILDWMARDRQFRRTIRLAVAEGLASDILDVRGTVEERPDRLISSALDSAALYGLSQTVLIGQFVQALSGPGIDPVVPVVRRVPVEPQNVNRYSSSLPETAGATGQPSTTGPDSPLMKGGVRYTLEVTRMAAFRNDRLVGWLDREESFGLVLLTRELRNTPLTFSLPAELVPPPTRLVVPSLPESPPRLPSPQHRSLPPTDRSADDPRVPRPPPSLVSVLLNGGPARIQPTVKPDGQIEYAVRLLFEAAIVEQMQGALDLPRASVREMLTQQIAQAISHRLRQALQRQNELGVDPAGFGLALYRSQPRTWAKVESHWRDLLPSIPISIDVKIRYLRTGLVIDVPFHSADDTELPTQTTDPSKDGDKSDAATDSGKGGR